MLIYKMLIKNRFREYERLIKNLFAPFVALIIVLGVCVYQTCIYLLPIIMEIETINHRSLNILMILFLIYGFYSCILRVRPGITLKPMTIHLFDERGCRKLVAVKYLVILLKHGMICCFLTICVSGLRMNFDGLYVFGVLFLYLEMVFWLSWICYHFQSKRNVWKSTWVLFSGLLALSNYFYAILFLEIFVVCGMFVYSVVLMNYDWTTYEDEMIFQEKILTAQNYNNTILLNQYSKEKRLRRISSSNKKSVFLSKYPLMWKAKTSITRLNREFVFAGVIVFFITFAIYKIPVFWSLPFLEQSEIRYILLMLGVLMAFQLCIQNMLKQLDSIMEKEKEGLFIPQSTGQILCKFTIFPNIVVIIVLAIIAVALGSNLERILIAGIVLLVLVWLLFYLELTRKELVKKIYFLSSICILFISYLMIS